jgi:aryl sulfotransferase
VPVRYRSHDDDSARWLGFPIREGDIVISTRSKHGTTWMQTICALLVFRTPDLPAPLLDLSPWLDWLVEPKAVVWGRLAAQEHRRFVKTHTPLDGVPLDHRVTYVVVARHPLDAAVSLHHHAENLDRARLRALLGEEEPARPMAARPPLREWLLDWIDQDAHPAVELDSLPGVLHHLSDAWARRGEPNVVLVHYDDLVADLDGEMRRLAGRLGITMPDEVWPALVHAAGFEQMRSRAGELVPAPTGLFRDSERFFRRGTSGAGAELLTAHEWEHYLERAGELAAPDLLRWLHRPGAHTNG